ncbi:MAG: dihydroorotate dehydrogenase electron transfer subunit [Clostridiales bacterium]|jgi:dihydroorotate dehydrogenase electron transfer subunit|nr:dihydroorotate dehydrogenase electron transfer subunit [Clostridiales bacterium]
MKMIVSEVIANDEIKSGFFNLLLKLSDNKLSDNLKPIPGQFVNLYFDTDMPLPRPISVCDFEDGVLRLVYQIVGKGTNLLSMKKPGEPLRLTYFLGNGFDITRAHGKILIVGGGIGVAPLFFLAKMMAGNNLEITVALGFASSGKIILAGEFEKLCNTYIATDDGSFGYKGNILDFIRSKNHFTDCHFIFACGPRPMLRALAESTSNSSYFKKPSSVQLSMEEHIACGIGACLCCPVAANENGNIIYRRVCADGPVFQADSLIWGGAS